MQTTIIFTGIAHGRTLPVKVLAQKQGCFKDLESPFYAPKDAFKKKGSAVNGWLSLKLPFLMSKPSL
jgi:hypothetical protein